MPLPPPLSPEAGRAAMQANARGRSKPPRAQKPMQVQRKPLERPPVPPIQEEGHTANKKQLAEKHAKLPPAPPDCGPWHAGPWEVRRATTYAPVARLVLTGPADDFAHFLAYLNAYHP